jgi:hypothetical protein
MALNIQLVNVSALADVSDYRVMVYINYTPIAGPFKVTGHNRSDGWFELAKKMVEQLDGQVLNDFKEGK